MILPRPRLWSLSPLSALLVLLSSVLACSEPASGPPHFEGERPEGEVAQEVLDVLSIPDSIDRVAGLAALLSRLDETALPEVVEAFEYQRPVLGDSEWMLLADWWTRFDTRGAYAWALSSREHKTPGVLRYVIAGMARSDPTAALVATLTLRSKEHQQAALVEIVKGWYSADPEGVIGHLISLTPGPDRQRAISTLVALKVRREGVDAARRWAESLDEELPHRFKLQTYRRLATELARVDLAAAQAWAEKHAPSYDGSNLYRRVAVVSAVTTPEASLAWLEQLPGGLERDQAVEAAYRSWFTNDPDAAKAWIAAAERGPWLQRALEIHLLSYAMTEPEKALALATELTDLERRQYAESRIAAAWFHQDPSAADAWLMASDLPPELQAKVRDQIARGEAQRLKMAEREERQRLRRQERAELELER